MHAASVSEFTCVSVLLTQRTLFSRGPPSLLALKLFPPPLPRGFLSPGGGGEFDGDLPFRAEGSEVSWSLHIVWLQVSV